jgi:uncharacterized protein (DUF427 family)
MTSKEEYLEARKIAKKYKICGEDKGGCKQLIKTSEAVRCEYWGQVSYWCEVCWEKVKND